MRKTIDIYHTIITRSFQIAFRNKALWPLGLFAGAITSGILFHPIVQTAFSLRPAGDVAEVLVQLFRTHLYPVLRLLEWAVTGGIARHAALVLVIVAIATLIVIAICAQQLLIEGAVRAIRGRKPATWRALKREVKHIHAWRLFGVNAILRIALLLVILAGAVPLGLLLHGGAASDAIVYIGFFVIALPLVFIINAVGMFTLIDIVRKNIDIMSAARGAWRTFKKHWLASLELAIILYGAVILAFLAFSFALIVVGIPVIFLNAVLVATGLSTLAILFSTLATCVSIVLILLFIGAVVSFNYASWVTLLERLDRFGVAPVLEHFAKLFTRRS